VATERSLTRLISIPRFELERLWWRATSENGAGYNAGPAKALRDALTQEEAIMHRVQSAIENQKMLREESNHRLLNGLQIVVSLLKMQARAAAPEVAEQLSAAAHRVMSIELIHRRLHIHEGTKLVAFKKHLEEFCSDFTGVMSPEHGLAQHILVQCDDIFLPTPVAIPLGFIISELITNAIKYGKGGVAVSLKARPQDICALTVANDGPPLPAGYDPASSKGLGMKIVQSFIRQIQGEFRFGRNEKDQGARFTVLFPGGKRIQA